MRPRLAYLLALAACSSGPSQLQPDAADADAPVDTPAAELVTFSYAPSWDGVVSVEVLGGFGQSGDWTTPLVTLTKQGATFSGTAMLAPGHYPYVFHVIGDAAAGASKAASYSRYAIDPAESAYVACPAASPTYSTMVANPCSQLSVPQAAAPVRYHVRGTVLANGAPAASYLVLLERMETGSHHFFVDRVTTAADGSYDLAAATGTYRIQIQHPQYESMTDAQLSPTAANILRRALSAGLALSADQALVGFDMAFTGYASFSPTVSAALPTSFVLGTTTSTHLDVYGGTNEIGDPWYVSPATTTGSASFDGTFNTMKATTPAVVAGTRYFWGVEQPRPKGSDGVTWTAQSMVFPITWH